MSAQEKDRPASRGRAPDDDALTEQLLAKGQAGLDATLPPTPLKQLLAADGASIYVFSADDNLVDVVQQAGGEQFPIQGLDDWQTLTDLVERGRCRIVLLDAEALGTQLERRVVELRSCATPLVILVAAPRDTAQKLIGLLSDRSIHRLLIKPVAPGITRLLLESAVSRYLQLREQSEQADGMAFDVPARPPQAPAGTKWPAWLLATALVSLLLGGAIVTGLSRMTTIPAIGMLLHRQTASTAPVGSTAPAAAASARPPAGNDAAGVAASERVGPPEANSAPEAGGATQAKAAPADPYRVQLDAAAAALAQGHVTEPSGDNALDDYAAILAKVPDQPEASRQMDRVMEILYGRAQDGLLGGKLDAAGEALDAIRRVRPDSKRLAFLDAQLARARQQTAHQAAVAKAAQAKAPQAKAAAEGASEANAPQPAPGAANAGPLSAGPSGASAAAPSAGGQDVQAAQTGSAEPGGAPTPAAPAAASTPAVPAAATELTNVLALARTRLQQKQLLEPAGDSARDYLQRATSLKSDDPRVLKLREDLAAAVAAQARLVLDQGDIEHADTLVRQAFALGADQETLAALDIDLDAARKAEAEKQRAALLANGQARLQAGQWIAPAKDNALYYLSTLKGQMPDYPGLDAAWSKLLDGMTANADKAIGGGKWSDAQRWVDALARTDADSATVAKLRERVQVGRRQEQYLKTPMPIGGLKVVEAGKLRYPADARRNNKQGYVDVQFIVGTDGTPRDAEVVDAQPAGWFEREALASVARYRFMPFTLDGHVYQRLVRARVRFNLQ